MAQTEQSATATDSAPVVDAFDASVAALEAAIGASDAPPPAADTAPVEPVAAPAEAAPAVAPPKVEEKPPEPEALSPQMEAIARREKRAMERDKAIGDREKALAEKEKTLATLDELASIAKGGNAKALAERLGLTKEAAQGLARSLWYEAMGEEAPADVRQQAELRQLREEQARQAKLLEEERAARASEREQSRVESARAQYAGQISAYVSAPFEGAPLVKAYAEESPQEMAQQLFSLGLRYAEANPEEPAPTPADLVKQMEAALEEQIAPLRKRGLLSTTPKANTTPVPEATAPAALTSQRAATAATMRAAELSDEERFEASVRAMKEASALSRGA